MLLYAIAQSLSHLMVHAALADMIDRVKGSSSKRLSEKGVLGFAWQNGDGPFSVSDSSVEAVTAYISDQAVSDIFKTSPGSINRFFLTELRERGLFVRQGRQSPVATIMRPQHKVERFRAVYKYSVPYTSDLARCPGGRFPGLKPG
jgi:hypothetical protein